MNKLSTILILLWCTGPACQYLSKKAEAGHSSPADSQTATAKNTALFKEGAPPSPSFSLKFINEQILPKNLRFQNIPVGGLSALTYDPKNKVFLALSDDKGNKGFPPRFYKFKLNKTCFARKAGDRVPLCSIDCDSVLNSKTQGLVFEAVSSSKVGMQHEKPNKLCVNQKKRQYSLELVDQVILRDSKGQPFSPIDPEGLAILHSSPDFARPAKGAQLNSRARREPGRILISSEGAQMPQLIAPPQVFMFNLKGQWLASFPVWDVYWRPKQIRKWGVKENKAFEALSLDPKQKYLYLATESSLYQDDVPHSVNPFKHFNCHKKGNYSKAYAQKNRGLLVSQDRKSCRLETEAKHSLSKNQQYVRIHRWPNKLTKKDQPAKYQQYIYPMDLEVTQYKMKGANGLTDFIALGNHQLFTVERAYLKKTDLPASQKLSANRVRLFLTDCSQATNIAQYKQLQSLFQKKAQSTNKKTLTTCGKTLIADLNQSGSLPVQVDNIEGIALGPKISKEKYLLVLVSDNNFSQKQKTQFLFFHYSL